MRCHQREVRCRNRQTDFQCCIIDCGYTQCVQSRVARHHVADIFHVHDLTEPGIWGRCFRIDQTAPGVNKIASGYRIAIGPFCIVTQRECENGVVVVGRVAQRHARYEVARGILVVQAFEKVTHNFGTRHIFYDLWVNR